ncbi:hypothetical protein [Pseudomonas chlororaphis]|uniref:hypothetical protein n=1 Tax=Pseudomonas chlororaphis TaxID=587753 RepID=UPI000F55B62F|nr:hypothetical protein [Pseudomonas chlororaphis]AZC67376.1 hypothetical protein C4K32_0687 [Pseudomonas chlororaphis subsp. piscium]
MSEWNVDDRPELPPEAGDTPAWNFDPNNVWLATAPEELQIEAMRLWFHARYQDPANDTPYNGREGGYQFIHGGPYDPDDVIQERFGSIVKYEVMEKLITELHEDVGGYEWAPIDHDPEWDYEEYYSMLPVDRTDPLKMLDERLGQIEDTITAQAAPQGFVIQLLHSAVITALEAYLWDTTAYWVTQNKTILQEFVKGNKDFAAKSFKLSEIFTAMDGIEKEVVEYLQTFIWHRLDKAKPLLEKTLGIQFPKFESIMPEIITRHDIVHRGGRSKDGYPVQVTIHDVRRVASLVKDFAVELESEIKKAFPLEGAEPALPDF